MQTDLLKRAQQGDKAARDALIRNNLGLVYSVIKRFGNRGYESEDLIQIGSIGLLKAVDHFNTDYDVQFSTYAVPLIIGEIKRFMRDDGPIKVSRTLKELQMKVRYLSEQIQKQEGRDAGVRELAKRLGVEVADIVEAMDAGQPVDSLDEPISDTDSNGMTVGEKIEDDSNNSETDIINRLTLDDAMSVLNARDQEVIYLRFYQRKTQMEIAQKFGVSQVQISRIEKKALKAMRSRLTNFDSHSVGDA